MKFLRYAVLIGAGTALAMGAALPGVHDLNGHPEDVLAKAGQVRVLLFLRDDCPISRRYAPELQRIAHEFATRPVTFWLVFDDRTETTSAIRSLIAQYHFPGTPVQDESHALALRAKATVAPEAAVFDKSGQLVYHGRIDDLYVDIGRSRQAADVHDLEDAVAATLAGKAVRQAETQAVGCSLADVE